ncbi:hypothetical protein QE152_g1579 [Popillia japonica]|uniref:Uncharacterized protein n=1 Tax=Popillia japonica TaxID=7064 RepID=A0AAW1N7I4_POPJA
MRFSRGAAAEGCSDVEGRNNIGGNRDLPVDNGRYLRHTPVDELFNLDSKGVSTQTQRCHVRNRQSLSSSMREVVVNVIEDTALQDRMEESKSSGDIKSICKIEWRKVKAAGISRVFGGGPF